MDVTRTPFSGENGFTLVEVMVATIILTVVLLPMLGIINQGNIKSQQAQERTVAMALAMEKMEQVKSFLPHTPDEFTPTNNNPPLGLGDIVYSQGTPEEVSKEVQKGMPKKFYRYVTVTPIADTDTEHKFNTVNSYYTYYDMTATVTVRWRDNQSGTDKTIMLTSELVGR